VVAIFSIKKSTKLYPRFQITLLFAYIKYRSYEVQPSFDIIGSLKIIFKQVILIKIVSYKWVVTDEDVLMTRNLVLAQTHSEYTKCLESWLYWDQIVDDNKLNSPKYAFFIQRQEKIFKITSDKLCR